MQSKLLLVCCFVGSLAISLNATNSDEQFLHKLLNVMTERFLAKINEQTNKISELTARIEKLEAKMSHENELNTNSTWEYHNQIRLFNHFETNIASSLSGCIEECKKVDQCAAITFNNASKGESMCYFYKKDQYGFTYDGDWVSILRNSKISVNGNIYEKNNCAFPGNEIAYHKISASECGNKCVQNPECTHFAHYSQIGYCHLINAKHNYAPFHHPEASCGHIRDRTQVRYISCLNNNNNNNKDASDKDLTRDLFYQADNVTSIEECAKICVKTNYKYMGLQNGNQCSCGSDLNLLCGGKFSNSVYQVKDECNCLCRYAIANGNGESVNYKNNCFDQDGKFLIENTFVCLVEGSC